MAPVLVAASTSLVTMYSIPSMVTKVLAFSPNGLLTCGKIFPDGKMTLKISSHMQDSKKFSYYRRRIIDGFPNFQVSPQLERIFIYKNVVSLKKNIVNFSSRTTTVFFF